MSRHIQIQEFSRETQARIWAGEIEFLPDGTMRWTDTAATEMVIKQELYDPESEQSADITDGPELFCDSLIKLCGNYNLSVVPMDDPARASELLPTPDGVASFTQFPKDIDRRLIVDDSEEVPEPPEMLAYLKELDAKFGPRAV